METVQWIIENWDSVLTITSYLIAIGWSVAKLTPNKKDDEFLGKVQKFFDVFNGNKVKITLKR